MIKRISISRSPLLPKKKKKQKSRDQLAKCNRQERQFDFHAMKNSTVDRLVRSVEKLLFPTTVHLFLLPEHRTFETDK